MGPRSDQRGKHECGPLATAAIASMGPRSDERGKGRARWWHYMAAELQWGRARMSAERIDRGDVWRLVAASMGPRSDERGKRLTQLQTDIAYGCFNGAALG